MDNRYKLIIKKKGKHIQGILKIIEKMDLEHMIITKM
jgi:hypothetical protein